MEAKKPSFCFGFCNKIKFENIQINHEYNIVNLVILLDNEFIHKSSSW